MLRDAIQDWRASRKNTEANTLSIFIRLPQQGRVYANHDLHAILTRPLNPEHRNGETQFVSLAPKLNSKWLNAIYMF